MDKKKMIYIGSLLILTAIISIASFSYAIWSNKSEQRGKLNIVAGSLRYELISDDLTNNSITIPANTNKIIEIEIKSLNNIESKYELYYESDNENISIGYSEETVDNPTGTMSARSSKKVTVIIKNRTSSPAIITFGTQGGFSDKTLTLAQGNSINVQLDSCEYDSGKEWEFPYNGTTGAEGSIQEFEVPCDGYYKLETWGAQGGSRDSSIRGGFGSYSVGVTNLNKDQTPDLYVVVGGQGATTSSTANYTINAGYNGGGTGRRISANGATTTYAGGGGATHIATESGLLKDLEQYKGELTASGQYYKSNEILIVSGGGGGSAYYYYNASDNTYGAGSNGGGMKGTISTNRYTYQGNTSYPTNQYGGTQTSGFAFGQGYQSDTDCCGLAGGGGGFYGGRTTNTVPAGGGSGYIASLNLNSTSEITKAMYCYDCEESLNSEIFTVSTSGSSSYKDTANCSNGYSTEPVSKCAKAGHGYARITYLGKNNDISPTVNYNVLSSKPAATVENTSYNYNSDLLNITYNTSNTASVGCRVIFGNTVPQGGLLHVKGTITVNSNSATAKSRISIFFGSSARGTDLGQMVLAENIDKGTTISFDETAIVPSNAYMTIGIGRTDSNYSGSLSGTATITDFYITDY